MPAGILNAKQLTTLFAEGKIHRPSGCEWKELLAHSSFDLPLGNEYWEMRGSCRAGVEAKVRDDTIPKFAKQAKPMALDREEVLKVGQVYVFRADCHLKLKNTRIWGKATGKSSIGRLDVLVRLLVDNSDSFDLVPPNYTGNLYIEVTPITFRLVVRPGMCLSQLRLCLGPEHLATLSLEALACEDDAFPVVDRDGNRLTDPCEKRPDVSLYPFSLDLSQDPETGLSAFVAKERGKLPTGPIDPQVKNSLDPAKFWEPVEWKNSAIDLKLDRLYRLRSRERLRIPAHLALECKSYTETMGEWRIEYAGFGHPFFGCSRSNGTPIIFEVRGHNIPTILTDHIPLGNVHFKRMSHTANENDLETTAAAEDYETQELKLSKCFKPWPA